MVKISPSLLAADFSCLKEELKTVEESGAEFIHLDVMDGHFVPNMSFAAVVIESIRKVSGLLFDTHLMISHPLKYIKAFADAGSDYITFHLESEDDPREVVEEIKKFGKKVGISVKPATKAEALLPYINDIDLVLVMTVEPGFGGQSFMYDMLPKITEIKQMRPDVLVSVDGGVNEKTAGDVKAAGADVLVAGSFFFKSKDKKAAAELLKA